MTDLELSAIIEAAKPKLIEALRNLVEQGGTTPVLLFEFQDPQAPFRVNAMCYVTNELIGAVLEGSLIGIKAMNDRANMRLAQAANDPARKLVLVGKPS